MIAAGQNYCVSRAWMSQQVNSYRRDGATALIDGQCGRAASNCKSDSLRLAALGYIRERHAGSGPTPPPSLLEKHHQIRVSRYTLRKWMVEDGI